VGRSYRDAPEVDGLVFLREDVPPGEIVPVRITGALEYDLVGELAGERTSRDAIIPSQELCAPSGDGR